MHLILLIALMVLLLGFLASLPHFLFISLNNSQDEILILCTIILGICIGLYFFNSYPAKLFLGDSGAQTFGFILATIAILYNPKIGTQSSTWFVPVMIFFIPLFDLVLVIFSRIRRKKKYIKHLKTILIIDYQ